MARSNLAVAYANGVGLPRDQVAAYTLLAGIRDDVCALDPESWKTYESQLANVSLLVELYHREATNLSTEERAEAGRR